MILAPQELYYVVAFRGTLDRDHRGSAFGVGVIIQRCRAVCPETLERVTQWFARFNLPDTVLRPA